LDEFERRSDLGKHARRTAKRQGLKIRKRGGRSFVLGEDYIAWLKASGESDDT
jgi:hypothetical protein